MSPFLDQDHAALRVRAREWVEKNLFSRRVVEQEVDAAARQLVRRLGDEGFLACAVPKQFGGLREKVQTRDLCILREEIARGSALADVMFALQALGSCPIALYGTAEQQSRYLPAIAKGEAVAAFALTEPGAGSDVASLQARAVRHGKEYCLSGTKRFISNAGLADVYVVFASTTLEQQGKGISAFVVDAKTAGLIIRERTQLISPHPNGIVVFEDCLVPQSSLLGREGEGLRIAFAALDILRCTVGAAAVGMAQRALEEALQYSQQRRQFGRALSEFEGIQFKLAEMATELEAARLLVHQAAWAGDTGADDHKRKSSMAKLYATEAAQRIVDEALQIHGGAGLIAGTIMERLYRDVRALRIYEGTSEIQKLIIAKELLKKRQA